MRIYYDTSTLPHNIRHSDEKTRTELAPLNQLAEKYSMFSSHLVRYEAEKTKDETQRNYLIIDYKGLEPIPEDEKPLGFHRMQTDIYGLRGARSLYERQT